MQLWFTKKLYNIVNFLFVFIKDKRDKLERKINPPVEGAFDSLFGNMDKIKESE